MNKSIVFPVMTILLLNSLSYVYACEPCNRILDFQETAKKADFIIIGQKISEGPWSSPERKMPGGPGWIKVEVLQILKGEEEKKIIKVNSWDAMCDYGITIGEGSHIIFLQKNVYQSLVYDYGSISDGCSIKSYAINEGRIRYDYKDVLLDEFVKTLHSYY